ncbi:MAG: hypothetical protein HY000_04065 [Planctomycetes bacterium]|nr:hypothetical protein [Planctomycetota bacterium]
MTEYEIQPLSLHCAQTGRELKPGETYYSALTESPEGFRRLDYSAEVWQGPPDRTVAFWRAKVPTDSGGKRRQMVDDSVVVEFFERLAGAEDATKLNFRYILALLLLRKKILKLTHVVHEEAREILVLRASAGATEHRVVNPGLTEPQLEAVQAEVDKILHQQ